MSSNDDNIIRVGDDVIVVQGNPCCSDKGTSVGKIYTIKYLKINNIPLICNFCKTQLPINSSIFAFGVDGSGWGLSQLQKIHKYKQDSFITKVEPTYPQPIFSSIKE